MPRRGDHVQGAGDGDREGDDERLVERRDHRQRGQPQRDRRHADGEPAFGGDRRKARFRCARGAQRGRHAGRVRGRFGDAHGGAAQEAEGGGVRDSRRGGAARLVPAGSLTARPIATTASATSATSAPARAGNRTRRAGVHARARVMAAATIATTVPRTGDGTGMSVQGPNTESSRDTKAGTTSPRMNDRTTAIVASTCRRSHTSATANRSSPDGRRQDVRFDLERPGRAVEPQPQRQGRRSERRPGEQPARSPSERDPRRPSLGNAGRAARRADPPSRG